MTCFRTRVAFIVATVSLVVPSFGGWPFFGEPHGIEIGRKVAEIDCTREYPTNLYFECGRVIVADSTAGTYREAEPTPDSRFGYRFAVRHVGKPHLAVVRYPDDKTRCMSVSDGTCYDLSIGVFTGEAQPHGRYTGLAQPLTGKMLEIRQVFWPRWKDCTIAFGNTTSGEPAAAASVAIYEVEALPTLKVSQVSADVPHRSLGISYEDPCSHASDMGATDYDQWLDRMVAFAKYEGMNRLTYPVIWYHGPLYPSPTEPANYFDWSVASPVNRNLYIRWTTHPDDWVEELLSRFDKERLEFVSQVTYIRLGSLMEKTKIDLDSIRAGEDTINNMRADDKVQSGAGDWTGEYNVRNFNLQCEYREQGESWHQCALQYGEVSNGGGSTGPIFNPVHPVVQEALLRSVREIATRYGKHPSYKGLHIFCYGSSTLGFGSIQYGYDDTTIRQFEQETATKVPVEVKLPDRFSKRHAFLTSKDMREKWIAWRCVKITDLLCRMRDELIRVRPDLELAVSPNGGRDAGIDTEALQKAGVIVTVGLNGLSPCASPVIPDAAATCRNVNIFNTWIERWGKHRWWACAPDDEQARKLGVILGKPAEGICRMGSEYAKDGFWWPEAQLRITPAFSGGDHFMRHYANAVACFDPLTLSRGGLTLDRGHADLLRPFAKAFRALPARKFETVGTNTDPVTVRTLVVGDTRYVYLVNREYYPSDVTVMLTNATGGIVNLSDRSRSPAAAEWKLKLGAYQLHSFTLSPEVGIVGFTTAQPEESIETLRRDTASVLAKIKASMSNGQKVAPQTAALENQFQEALKNAQWTVLRQLLENVTVRNFR